MPKPPGLQRRKNTYYIRVRVPQDLINVMKKSEVIRSLKTKDYDTACRQCYEERVKINDEFANARTKEKKTPHIRELSKDQKKEIVTQWFLGEKYKYETLFIQNTYEPNEWQEKLTLYREDVGIAQHALKENDLNFCRHIAADELEKQNIQYETDEYEFKFISRLFLEAYTELSEYMLSMHLGKTQFMSNHSPSHFPDFKGKRKSPNSITLEKLVQEYFSNKGQNWTDKTKLDYETSLNLMLEFLGKETHVDELTRQDCRMLSKKMKEYPANLRKSYPADKYSLKKAYTLGIKSNMPPISISTYNDYIGKFSSLMTYAYQETYIAKNPALGLQQKEVLLDKDKRDAFTIKQLNQIFHAPLYTGCLNATNGHNKVGNVIPKDSYRFWIPLLGLWTGMRLNEICQLEVDDIAQENEIDVIYIRTESSTQSSVNSSTLKRVKNKNSVRYIPIHSELKKIGFLELIKKRQKNSQYVFEDFVSHKGNLSNKASRWFNETFLPKQIEKSKKTVFHSFRHTYRDAMRNAEIPEEAICLLGGWSQGDAVHKNYGSGYTPERLSNFIEKLEFTGLDLSHLHTEIKG